MGIDYTPKDRPVLDCSCDKGRTKEAPANAADINNLAGRYLRKNQASPGRGLPAYGDFTNVDDYMTARNKVIDAQHAFASLPSLTRNRFENDPAQLIAFLADPENLEEAQALGLAELPPEGDPVEPAAPPEGE